MYRVLIIHSALLSIPHTTTSIMRTFGDRRHSNYKGNANTYQRRQEYKTRTSNEWDLRIDLVGGLTVDALVAHAQLNLGTIVYIMVSGIESPDLAYNSTTNIRGETITKTAGSVSQELHVHVGVVSQRLMTRQQAIDLLIPQGTVLSPGQLYAVPRNTKFSYVGWVCHHSKELTKLKDEPGLRYEYGILPLDTFDINRLKDIDRMIRKFGNAEMRVRFKFYQDALKTAKELDKIDQAELANLPAN